MLKVIQTSAYSFNVKKTFARFAYLRVVRTDRKRLCKYSTFQENRLLYYNEIPGCVGDIQRLTIGVYTGFRQAHVHSVLPHIHVPSLASVNNDAQGNKDIDNVMNKIVKKLMSNGKDMKEETYSEIRTKLEILHKNDCVISVMPECLDVLNLSVEEIEERGEKLRKAHMFIMTPDLFVDKNESLHTLKTMAYRQLKKITGLEKVEDLLRLKLEVKSQEEWECLKPYVIKDVSSVSSFYHKVDSYIASGISLEELKSYPKFLKLRYKNFMSRRKILNQSFPFLKRDSLLRICELDYYIIDTKIFSKEKGLLMYVECFSGCKTVEQAVSQLQEYLDERSVGKTNPKHLNLLKRKASYLSEIGISPKCIVENIYCLTPPVSRLKNFVGEIKKGNDEVVNSEKLMAKIFENLKGKKTVSNKSDISFLKEKYHITDQELEEIKPYVGGLDAQKSLTSKIDFLLEQGYSLNEITKHPQILKKDLNVLKGRLQALRKGDEKCQPLLESLTFSNDQLSYLKSRVQNYRASLGKAKSKMEALSQMLDVDLQSKSNFDPILHVRLDHLKLKIEYLVSIGISKKEIIEDIFCLTLPLTLIRRNVKVLKETSKSQLTLRTITNHANKSMSNQPTHCPSKTFIKRMLSLTQQETRRMEARYLYNTTQVLQKNLRLMIDRGFTLESLKSCPYIITHSTEVLEEYLDELPNMEELQLYEDLGSDKHKLVNFLQYKIEKNHEFRRVVNDGEEILAVDQSKLSFYFSQADKR